MMEQGGVCRKEVEKPLERRRETEEDLLTSRRRRLRNKDMISAVKQKAKRDLMIFHLLRLKHLH
ncbi:hypothetical protein YC2023_048089 [Brassica napus]